MAKIKVTSTQTLPRLKLDVGQSAEVDNSEELIVRYLRRGWLKEVPGDSQVQNKTAPQPKKSNRKPRGKSK
jgi:hypothetical protein